MGSSSGFKLQDLRAKLTPATNMADAAVAAIKKSLTPAAATTLPSAMTASGGRNVGVNSAAGLNFSSEKANVNDAKLDEELRLQFEKLTADETSWDNPANAAEVCGFLQKTRDIYGAIFKAAVSQSQALQMSAHRDANTIGAGIFLEKRIKWLRQIFNDYEDCLNERCLKLKPVQENGNLSANIDNRPNEIDAKESFKEAIFTFYHHKLPLQVALADMVVVLTKFGNAGVNGLAGRALCELVFKELRRRIERQEVNIFENDIYEIAIRLRERSFGNYLQLGKLILRDLKRRIDQAATPAVDQTYFSLLDVNLFAIIEFFGTEKLSAKHPEFMCGRDFQDLFESITRLILQQLRNDEIKYLDLELRRVCLFFKKYANDFAGALHSYICQAVMQDISSGKVDEQDETISGLLEYFLQQDAACYAALGNSIAQRRNLKANAFRCIYASLHIGITHTGYENYFFGKALKQIKIILWSVISPAYSENFLAGKDALPANDLLAAITRTVEAQPDSVVAFVWKLTTTHLKDASSHNTVLFQELYKKAFALSVGGISQVGGQTFFRVSPEFTTAIDNLQESDLERHVNSGQPNRTRAMFNALGSGGSS